MSAAKSFMSLARRSGRVSPQQELQLKEPNMWAAARAEGPTQETEERKREMEERREKLMSLMEEKRKERRSGRVGTV